MMIHSCDAIRRVLFQNKTNTDKLNTRDQFYSQNLSKPKLNETDE